MNLKKKLVAFLVLGGLGIGLIVGFRDGKKS